MYCVRTYHLYLRMYVCDVYVTLLVRVSRLIAQSTRLQAINIFPVGRVLAWSVGLWEAGSPTCGTQLGRRMLAAGC